MWSGHLLQLVTLYEALLGDDRFADEDRGLRTAGACDHSADCQRRRRRGASSWAAMERHKLQDECRRRGLTGTGRKDELVERLEGHAARCHASSTDALAARLADSMNANPTGGVPCEPGLVFFQCQNHPQIALRLLEKLRADKSAADSGEGDFRRFGRERRRWESYALTSMRSPTRNAAFKMAVRAEQGAAKEAGSIPFGHMGADGWNLTYYFAWATSQATAREIWHGVTAPILAQFDTFENEPSPCCRKADNGDDHGEGSPPPNHCCFGLNIPSSVWSVALLPAMAQAGDWEQYGRVASWLRRHFRRETRDALGRTRVSLTESVEWAIGNSANYLLAVTLAHGSSLRAIVQASPPRRFLSTMAYMYICKKMQAPPPRKFFGGALLLDAHAHLAADVAAACAVDVFRCWRRDPDGVLIVGLQVFFCRSGGDNGLAAAKVAAAASGGDGVELHLELANVPTGVADVVDHVHGRRNLDNACEFVFQKDSRGLLIIQLGDDFTSGGRVELSIVSSH